MRSIPLLLAILAVAALLAPAAQAQPQAIVEGEAYAAELVTVSLSGLAQGTEYRVEVVDGQGGLAAFTLIAYAGSITVVDAGDGYVVFTADGDAATLYLRAGPAGSYTLRVLEAGQLLAEYPVTVEPYDARGGAEPDVAVDTGYELVIAIAAALGMTEVAGATIYQAVPAGDDGRATIYVVDDVAVSLSASFTGDFQALNDAGTREVLIAGAYKGVFAAEAALAVDGATLSFTLSPGPQVSGVKFEYLNMYTENGGIVEFTSFYAGEGQAPTYLSFTKMTFNGDVKVYAAPVDVTAPDFAARLGFLQFKKAYGAATVYLEEPVEVGLAGLSLIESGMNLKLINKSPQTLVGVVLTEQESIASSIEVRGSIALIGGAGATLKVDCVRFVAEPGYPDPTLPYQLLLNLAMVVAGDGATTQDPFTLEVDCFRVEADVLATTPGDIMSAYGTFGMAGVYLKAAMEALLGYGNVTVTDEGPKPESSRPQSVVVYFSTIEAPTVQIGGVYSTQIADTTVKAETVIVRGAAVGIQNSAFYTNTALIHPLVFNVPVNIIMDNSEVEAATLTYICGTSEANIKISNSLVAADTIVFRGYATATFENTEIYAAAILGGGATPVGGSETLVIFGDAWIMSDLEIAPLDYGVAVSGVAYLGDMASVYLNGARLDNAVFKAESVTAALVAEGATGGFRVEARDATLYFAGSSPEAYGYFKTYGASTIVVGCCTSLAGATFHAAGGETEIRLLGSFTAGEYIEVKVEEAGNAKVYLRGGLSGEATLVEAPVFKVTTGVTETVPGEIMDAAGEFVAEAVYIKGGDVILGYGNVTVTDQGPRPESSRPATVKVYRAVIEAQGTAMIGGVNVTHVKAATVKAGKIVLRGASGEYLAATLQADEIYVHPLVFGVDVKHAFRASTVEAATALRYICGTAQAEIHFYDSTIKAQEATAAGRATLKFAGSTIEVPVFRLGGATPVGGDVNKLMITESVVAAEAFKVYSLDYPVVVYIDETVEVKAGMVEFKAGNAPLTLGDEQVKAKFKAYGANGSLYLKAVNASGRLEVYLEPGVATSTVYLEGAGDSCFKLLVPAGASHEATIEKLAGPAFKLVAGDGSNVKLYFAEGEHRGSLIQVKQGRGASVAVEAAGATATLGEFQAITATTATAPTEVMEATGYLKIAGGTFIVEGNFTAGYGNVAITEEGPVPESARPAVVHVEDAAIEAQGTVMIGGVKETRITGSTIKAGTLVVRGAEAYLEGSSVAAEAAVFHPLVFFVPVEVKIAGSTVDAGVIRYICGTAQAMITVEESTLGSMERPTKIYIVGIANMLVSNSKAYIAESVAGLLTPIQTGKYAHIAFVNSEVEAGEAVFKYGPKGAAFAFLGGTFKADKVSLVPVEEGAGSGVLTIAGANASIASCGDVAGSIYLVDVAGDVNCPAAEVVSLPEGAERQGSTAVVLTPGVKEEAGSFLVKLAGGFNGPVAVYAAFAVADAGEPYLLLVPVNLAYQSQVYEVYYPLPDCQKLFILVDELSGATLDAAKPEDPENCVFKSHLRVKPEAAGNAEPILAAATAAAAEVQVTITQTVTQVQTVTQTVTATATTTQTATVTTTTVTTTTVTQTQTNMGAVAAAAIIGLIVGAAAAFALRARS